MTPDDICKYSYLVVDDDEISQHVLNATLAHIGATKVFFADDAFSALAMAKQHRPDFILLDIYMPEVDGWALLDQLRRLLPQTVVLMVTGSHLPADFVQSMTQRADGFCIKPVMSDLMLKNLVNAKNRRDLKN